MARHYRNHLENFAGYPVVEWKPGMGELPNPEKNAFAIRLDWSSYDSGVEWTEYFKEFIEAKGVEAVPAFIVGSWGYESGSPVDEVIEIIAAHRQKLPSLKALFMGDIPSEENEISWIQQGDISPLLNAYPNLEHLVTRGGNNLRFGNINMPRLKTLRIESGGLPREVVRSVGAGNFPELENVILWLGTEHYGANTTIADLQGFYECKGMPSLKYLGLCDSDIADAIASFIATAPVLERLESLDLSMGTLSDEGALALLKSPMLKHLKFLDLHHNFFSAAMIEKLNALQALGITVDSSDNRGERATWRFVAVGE